MDRSTLEALLRIIRFTLGKRINQTAQTSLANGESLLSRSTWPSFFLLYMLTNEPARRPNHVDILCVVVGLR